VSKFFQALENAEKERAAAEAVPDTPLRETATTGAVATTAPPDAAAVPVAPRATVAPPAPAAAPAPPAMPAARAHAAPVYGAPVARSRRKSRGHADVFVSDTAGPAREQGQLDDHLVSLLEPTSFAAEQYRAVRLAIENYRRERGLNIVAISSPGRGEGKTMTAINLAGALAQSADARVALVDADLRHPRVADYLGLPPASGLSGYLLDPQMELDAVLARHAGTAFAVVPAGARTSMPYELLKSPRLTALFQALRARFDYVVVDTPPTLLFPDVGILRDAVDGFVLVARANRTPREGLVDGLDAIGRHRVVGVVFNDDERSTFPLADADVRGRWRRYVPVKLGGVLVD
jgi:capsular exopolysaccharide synthesis family protein